MIIGISGKIGSGKDTVGKAIQVLTYLKEHDIPLSKSAIDYNWNSKDVEEYWEIKKFAGKLKQMASLLTGIPVTDFEKQEVKDTIMPIEWQNLKDANGTFVNAHYTEYTYRWLLQKLGTEAIRDTIHPNAWVNALFADYKPINESLIRAKIKGQRHAPNPEYPNWIITDIRFPNELKAVRERKGISIRINRNHGVRLKGVNYSDHPSETALDTADFHHTIDNNGTIEELVEKVKEILITEQII